MKPKEKELTKNAEDTIKNQMSIVNKSVDAAIKEDKKLLKELAKH